MDDSARRLIAALAAWIEPRARSGAEIAEQTGTWGQREWVALPRFVTIHGLAPRLTRSMDAQALAGLPSDFTDWLGQQETLNTLRIDRMHSELAAILGAAAAAGIRVMPLKGAALTTIPGSDPHRRPMGDLDLLISPDDSAAMGEILERLGYEFREEPNPRPMPPRMYVRPDNERVVSLDEHPDNPRRVELHTAVMRHLWGWVDEDDLTDAMWRNARDGTVLNEPAVMSSRADLFAHVAIHASSDLLVNHGRLNQWADIADLLTGFGQAPVTPHPRLAYLSTRLASRAMPEIIPDAALRAMEARVPPGLRRWLDSVDIAGFPGLMTDESSRAPWLMRERLGRWWPSRWRLAIAHGDAPLPVALARHARVMAGFWRRRYRGPARQPLS